MKLPARRRTLAATSLAAVALCAALSSASPGPEPDDGQFRRTGILTAWRIDVDGTVFLQIDTVKPTTEVCWFKSPPLRNAQTRLSQMLVDVAIAYEEKELTVIGQLERALDGTTPDEAYLLEAVERR